MTAPARIMQTRTHLTDADHTARVQTRSSSRSWTATATAASPWTTSSSCSPRTTSRQSTPRSSSIARAAAAGGPPLSRAPRAPLTVPARGSACCITRAQCVACRFEEFKSQVDDLESKILRAFCQLELDSKGSLDLPKIKGAAHFHSSKRRTVDRLARPCYRCLPHQRARGGRSGGSNPAKLRAVSLKRMGLPASDDNAAAMLRALGAAEDASIAYGEFRRFAVLIPGDKLGRDAEANLTWFESATCMPLGSALFPPPRPLAEPAPCHRRSCTTRAPCVQATWTRARGRSRCWQRPRSPGASPRAAPRSRCTLWTPSRRACSPSRARRSAARSRTRSSSGAPRRTAA